MNTDVDALISYADTLQSMRDQTETEEPNDELADEALDVIETMRVEAEGDDEVWDVVNEMLDEADEAVETYIDDPSSDVFDPLDTLFKFTVVLAAGIKNNDTTAGAEGMYY